jgi:hypothetical protein
MKNANRLEGENRVAFRYAKGENPNGRPCKTPVFSAQCAGPDAPS